MTVDRSCIPGPPSRANAGATSSSIAAATQLELMTTPRSSSGVWNPRLRLPVRERTVKPSLGRPWRGLGHRLDEGELSFVDAHPEPGSIVRPYFAVLALEKVRHVRHRALALVA